MGLSACRGNVSSVLRSLAMAPAPEPERRRARLRKLRLPRACRGPVARRDAKRHFPRMRPHKACNFSIRPISRGYGQSAVAAAAYRAGAKYFDERVGRVRNYRCKRDVMSIEMVGWEGDPETFWNLVEASESRCNSRVARDFIISLPAELPLAAQVKLTRGYALWLRDRYGTPSMVAIHAPVGHAADPYLEADENIITDLQPRNIKKAKPKGDPRNHHVHILTATREWNAAAGSFGKKARALDDREDGPKEVQTCRDEWQKRVNSVLKKYDIDGRVDLRSYEKMVAAGDIPEGLVPQPKRGPASVGRSRRLERDHGEDSSSGGRRQAEIQKHNDEVWEAWELRRHLARARAREDGTSEKIAASREAARRERAEVERHGTAPAATQAVASDPSSSGPSFDPATDADPFQRALRDVRAGLEPTPDEADEFDEVIDPEYFQSPDTKVAPRLRMKSVRRCRQRERHRGE